VGDVTDIIDALNTDADCQLKADGALEGGAVPAPAGHAARSDALLRDGLFVLDLTASAMQIGGREARSHAR
jgi:hypothetical protein